MHTLYLPDGRGLILKGRSAGMSTKGLQRLLRAQPTKENTMKPSLGRVVLYTLTKQDKMEARFDQNKDAADVLPADVVHVSEDGSTVDLRVKGRGIYEFPYLASVPAAPADPGTGEPGTWHWPPRV